MKRYVVLLIVGFMILSLACLERKAPVEKKEVVEEIVAYTVVSKLDDLKNFVDKKIRITGTISHEPWQHLIAPTDSFPVSTYFDVGDKQTIIYSKKELACEDCECKIQINGTAIEVKGKGKGPRSDEDYIEYHITADSWKCLEDGKCGNESKCPKESCPKSTCPRNTEKDAKTTK